MRRIISNLYTVDSFRHEILFGFFRFTTARMKADQDRLKVLLVDTIALLCKSGLTFKRELRVQGLLGITVDDEEVFIVQLDEKLFSDGLSSCGPFDSSDTCTVLPASPPPPPHPVLLSRVIPSSPPTRGTRGRGRPPLANRTVPAKRQRIQNESFFSTGFETNAATGCVPMGSDLNLNEANAHSPSELSSLAMNESAGEFGSVNNALVIRPVNSVADSFQPEYTSLPFDNTFLHPDFTTARFAGGNDDLTMPAPSGEVRQKIKRKIKNTGNLNQCGIQEMPASQQDQIRYDVGNQWSSDGVSASGDQTPVDDMWESGTRNVKHETPDDSFNDSSFNDSVGGL